MKVVPCLPGERNPLAKLTDATAAEIRHRYVAEGVTQQSLADEYDVSQKVIWRIVNNIGYAQ